MRYLLSIAAALSLASYAVPALAFSTASPAIKLVPLGATKFAVTTHGADCDAPAAIDGTPFFQMPAIAAEEGVSGVAQVKIDLTSAGYLAAEQLFATSGNRWLDRAALLSAKMTHYTAESVNCQHVAGSYLYEVEF